MRGQLITFEGVDGAGKSTHIEWFANELRSAGRGVVVTREPGGSELAEKMRELVLHDAMDAVTETLLVFAARHDHLNKRILPALAAGTWVVCDRFSDATFAYQGAGRGADWDKLKILERWVQDALQPDLTLLFDLPPGVGKQRTGSIKSPDRFEQEQHEFFERVRVGYLKRAEEAPTRIQVVDASQSIEAIRQHLAEILTTLFQHEL